jgi:hypothetical protein
LTHLDASVPSSGALAFSFEGKDRDMWYYGAFALPDWVPEEFGREVAESYWQYLRERERDIAEGVAPATDTVQSWRDYLREYVKAELEAR